MCTNIELFDEYAARVLSQLYEQFPVKTGIDVRKLTGHVDTNEYGAILSPDGQRSRQAEIAYATIEWLVETGYIRCKKAAPPYGYSQCVLTAKGLEILKATPASVQSGKTIGDRLVQFVREGALDLAGDAVKAALAAGIKMLD